MNFKVIDCCPAPAQLYPLLLTIKNETGCVYQSVYRGTDRNAAQYLTGAPPCSKHTQTWIYAHYPPGVANPPGRSTHELKNDGAAYAGWAGMPLHWWQCGIDIDDAHVASFIEHCARHGWHAHITYPTSRVEYHHVNLTKPPRITFFKPLKRGANGRRVRQMTNRLSHVRSPVDHKPYIAHRWNHFGAVAEQALKHFQKEHYQKADGIYGPQTDKQLRAAYRNAKKKGK